MRKFNKLMALVLSLALCLSLAVTVSAADSNPANNKAGIWITKQLKIAEGTTVPDAKFTFVFAGNEGKSTGVTADEIPDIDSVVLDYSQATDTDTIGQVNLRSANIIANLDGDDFPHAGVYAYTVTESTDYGVTLSANETMTPGGESYTLRIYVSNVTDTKTEINYVTIQKGEGKITSTTDGITETNTTTEDSDITGTNGFKFTNNYSKKLGDENTPAVVISNQTVGDFANKDKKFDFSMTVSLPDNVTTGTYTYVVVSDDVKGEKKTGTYGTPVPFALNDNDTVEIFDVVAGAKYSVTQTAATDYITTIKVNGEDANAVENVIIKDTGKNTAEFTNTYKDIIPTGIELNNAPFMLMIGAAGIFMLLMLMSKKRREEA